MFGFTIKGRNQLQGLQWENLGGFPLLERRGEGGKIAGRGGVK